MYTCMYTHVYVCECVDHHIHSVRSTFITFLSQFIACYWFVVIWDCSFFDVFLDQGSFYLSSSVRECLLINIRAVVVLIYHELVWNIWTGNRGFHHDLLPSNFIRGFFGFTIHFSCSTQSLVHYTNYSCLYNLFLSQLSFWTVHIRLFRK